MTAGALNVGADGGKTTTLKLRVTLNGGVPLSVTDTLIRFVEGDWAIAGRQVSSPLVELIFAPAGGFNRLQASVWAGTSASVALLVTRSVCPATRLALGMAASIGGVLAGKRTPCGTTSRVWLALSHSSEATAGLVLS